MRVRILYFALHGNMHTIITFGSPKTTSFLYFRFIQGGEKARRACFQADILFKVFSRFKA